MAKLRSVNTGFWEDEYVGDLTRDEQLLFLYLLTNPLTNMAGAYKIARRVIRMHTGFTDEEFDTILAKFEQDGKAIFREGWVVLPNWLKNQSLNDNMKKGVLTNLADSPPWVIQKVLKCIRKSVTLSKAFKGFQSLITELETLCAEFETLRKDEIEKEIEREVELLPPNPHIPETPQGGVEQKEKKAGAPRKPLPQPSEILIWLDAISPVMGAKNRKTLANYSAWERFVKNAISEGYAMNAVLDTISGEKVRLKDMPQFLSPDGILKILQANNGTYKNGKSNDLQGSTAGRSEASLRRIGIIT